MSGTKPTVFPEFARLDLPNGPGGNNNVVEPSGAKKDSGWDVGERPARETFNWLHRITNEWLEYIDGCLDVLLANGTPNTQFAQNTTATSGLNFVVNPGKYTVAGDEKEISTTTILNLVDNATNFVWLDVVANSIQFADESTTPPELNGGANIIPLFRVSTGAGNIGAVIDLRSWLVLGGAPGSEGVNSQFNYDEFFPGGAFDARITAGKYTVDGDEFEAPAVTFGFGPTSTNFVWLDMDTNTIESADEAGVPPELNGGRNIVPLWRFVVNALGIQSAEDLRSFIVLPRQTYALTDEQTNFEAGVSTDGVEITPTDTTPTQDLALGNSFFWRADAAVTSFTFQDPQNPQAAGASSASPVMTLVIKLDNSGQTGSFSGKYVFVNQPGGTYVVDGSNALLYIISGVYDPVDDEWLCTVTPQAV